MIFLDLLKRQAPKKSMDHFDFLYTVMEKVKTIINIHCNRLFLCHLRIQLLIKNNNFLHYSDAIMVEGVRVKEVHFYNQANSFDASFNIVL